jgi:hypothetical protein
MQGSLDSYYINLFYSKNFIGNIEIQKDPSNPKFSYLHGFSVEDFQNINIFRYQTRGWDHQIGSFQTKGGLSLYQDEEWNFKSSFPDYPISSHRYNPAVLWYKSYKDFEIIYMGTLAILINGEYYLFDDSDGFFNIRPRDFIDKGDKLLFYSDSYGAVEFDPLDLYNYISNTSVDNIDLKHNKHSIDLTNHFGSKLLVYNSNGSLIYNKLIYQNNLNTIQFANGVYFIKIISDNRTLYGKFLVNN